MDVRKPLKVTAVFQESGSEHQRLCAFNGHLFPKNPHGDLSPGQRFRLVLVTKKGDVVLQVTLSTWLGDDLVDAKVTYSGDREQFEQGAKFSLFREHRPPGAKMSAQDNLLFGDRTKVKAFRQQLLNENGPLRFGAPPAEETVPGGSTSSSTVVATVPDGEDSSGDEEPLGRRRKRPLAAVVLSSSEEDSSSEDESSEDESSEETEEDAHGPPDGDEGPTPKAARVEAPQQIGLAVEETEDAQRLSDEDESSSDEDDEETEEDAQRPSDGDSLPKGQPPCGGPPTLSLSERTMLEGMVASGDVQLKKLLRDAVVAEADKELSAALAKAKEAYEKHVEQAKAAHALALAKM